MEGDHVKAKDKRKKIRAKKPKKKKVFDPREGLSEQQLATLDAFTKRVATPLDNSSPIWKEAHQQNEKALKKQKKRKETEPPIMRLWTAALTKNQEAWLDDMCLCRYLRARDWDLNKSEMMIRATLAWREDYKPDEINLADIEEEAQQGKVYFNNEFLPNGWPVVWMKVGRDKGTDRVRKLKFLVWSLEQLIKAMDTSKGVEKMCWVTDFKGTGVKSTSTAYIQISLDCLHVLLNHYPERLGVAYAVNPPKLFAVFWKILTPFMNEVTLNKIKFVAGPKEYRILQEGLGKDLLEKTYGGNKDYEFSYNEWRVTILGGQVAASSHDADTSEDSKSDADEVEAKEKGKRKKGKDKQEGEKEENEHNNEENDKGGKGKKEDKNGMDKKKD